MRTELDPGCCHPTPREFLQSSWICTKCKRGRMRQSGAGSRSRQLAEEHWVGRPWLSCKCACRLHGPGWVSGRVSHQLFPALVFLLCAPLLRVNTFASAQHVAADLPFPSSAVVSPNSIPSLKLICAFLWWWCLHPLQGCHRFGHGGHLPGSKIHTEWLHVVPGILAVH